MSFDISMSMYIVGNCWRCGCEDQNLVFDPMIVPESDGVNKTNFDFICVCAECAAERYVIHHERKHNNA